MIKIDTSGSFSEIESSLREALGALQVELHERGAGFGPYVWQSEADSKSGAEGKALMDKIRLLEAAIDGDI